VLVVLVAWVGAEPFVTAARTVHPAPLAAAAAVAVLTTCCAAWRWRLVARGIGVEVRPVPAVAAYYRSQFLNLTIPGGVVGDVHRGIRNGSHHGTVQLGLRAVAWERAAGQAVQLLLTVALLTVLPTPLRPLGIGLLVALAVGVLVAALGRRWTKGLRGTRVHAAVVSDLRSGVLAPGTRGGIAAASTGAFAGHLLTFWLAARTVGVDVTAGTLVPVAACVLLAAAIPANVVGWGPREGTAAWAFAAVGLDPAQGVTVAAVYGLMAFTSVLPGALVLAATPAYDGARARLSAAPRDPSAQAAAHG
jgi:glycosyltransferase 2 family protein